MGPVRGAPEPITRLLEVGPGRFAHASGALWLPGEGTALIADVHLGYGWAQRRRGELGPVRDGVAGDKIDALMAELSPCEVVLLGDAVHAARPGRSERALIEAVLASLASRVKLTIVRGNHDRAFSFDFPLVDEWRRGDIVAVHGDRPARSPGCCLVLGHLHPAVKIRDDAGATQRVPVFLAGGGVIVLPAFSPFAAGFDITRGVPRGFAAALPRVVEALAATGTRVVRLGPITRNRE